MVDKLNEMKEKYDRSVFEFNYDISKKKEEIIESSRTVSEEQQEIINKYKKINKEINEGFGFIREFGIHLMSKN